MGIKLKVSGNDFELDLHRGCQKGISSIIRNGRWYELSGNVEINRKT